MLPNSRFTVEIAAAQGVYSNVNIKKLNALKGENNVCNVSPSSATLAPVNTANVLITASFAVKPVTSAVETRQSEKPIGIKIPLIMRPITASRLFVLPET